MSNNDDLNNSAEEAGDSAGGSTSNGGSFRSEREEVGSIARRDSEVEDGQLVMGDSGGYPPFFDADGNQIDITTYQAVLEHYSGPLPAPRQLAEYDQILPGAADRILKMAESELATKNRSLDKLVDTESKATLRVANSHVLVVGALSLATVIAVYVGRFEVGAVGAVCAALLTGTPQIIEAIRKRK